MNAEEREQFRSAHADKSKDELFAAHNLRGTMVKAAREEQLVLHDLITEKEEIEQREASSGRVQKIGLDGGIDDLQQTAQTTALELTFNAGATLGAGSVDVYTSDITVTNMITGEKYAFAYGGQLLLPSPPGQIRS